MRLPGLLPFVALCASIAAGGAPGHAEDAHLIRQGEASGFVFSARNAPISAALEELQTVHGLEVAGGHHVQDREISGRFTGTLPEVIERIFTRENFALFFRDAENASGTRLSRLVFTGRADAAAPAVEPAASASSGATRTSPAMDRSLYYDDLPPPPIPDIVLHAISPPPPGTPERAAFENALAETEAELEEALRPLRQLGN